MIVFTNGCFDIIHAGHVDLLERARALGTKLIVGINSDESVRSIKGPGRPVQDQASRKAVLLGLKSVDDVLVFDELTPENLIKSIRPDVLVKGGDWRTNEIIGSDFVQSYGGQVFSLPLLDGHSSSKILNEIKRDEATQKAAGTSTIEFSLNQHLETIRSILDGNIKSIEDSANLILQTFQAGKKVLLCGNGGSAADAQHIAAEFVGRYET